MGVFTRIMTGLAAEAADEKTIMIDTTYPKARRTVSSLRVKKGGRGRLIGCTKGFEGSGNCLGDSFPGERNTKLHAVADAQGRPIRMFVTVGPVSDYTGDAAMLSSLPQAE